MTTSIDTRPNNRILVIDDNAAIHDDFRKILERAGAARGARLQASEAALFGEAASGQEPVAFNIDSAYQGQEGLEKVRKARAEGCSYGLAFVDIRMPPGWDGIETIQHLWRAQPDLQVVICTAYSDYSWDEVRQKLGDTENLLILRKPFDNIEVLQMAKALTRKWAATREAETYQKNLELIVKKRTRQLEEENQVRRQAEEALRVSEERFRTLVERSPLGIVTRTLDGRFRTANPAFCEMLGYSELELQQLTVAELSLPEEFVNEQAEVLNMEVNHTPGVSLEKRYRTKSGRLVWASLRLSVVYEADGSPQFVIGAVADITERKQAEAEKEKLEAQNRQLQKSESLGRMARAIAHHFNNQLQAVMMNLEMAMDDLPGNAGPVGNLTQAMQSARKAAEVSSLMLTYLGQTLCKHEPLDLSEACQRHLLMLRAVMPQRVVLETDLPPGGPTISANVNQIQQVLTNLVTNAWEASGDGRCAIRLTVKTVTAADIPAANRFPTDWQPQDNAYASLEVADAGCGIADNDIETLFDPFFSTKFTGRGLGLAVVLGIVRAHHGVITVASEPGRGSVFQVFLPLSAEAVSQKPVPVAHAPKTAGGGTMLVVEDELVVRKVVMLALQRLGFAVLEAADGVEAVEVFRQHRDEISCVLCDLSMPRMDGWETLTALRQLTPGIPVILASGYSETEVMERDHLELPQAFLSKPYQIQALGDAIRRALGSV